MQKRFSPVRGRSGLTLIELVVVLLIVAALAGLVIPQISMLGRSTDMAASAKSQADVANNVSLFFTLQKRYPRYMDSLLDGGTAIYSAEDASGNPTTDPNAQATGLPASTITFPNGSARLSACLQVATLDNSGGAEYYRSFSRCGFDFVMDHDRTILNSNNSGIIERPLASGMNVAEVIPGSGLARAIYPATAGVGPANTRLIALGVGPRSSCIPTTMLQAPIYPGCDGTYYGRYIAYFQVFATGERAVLVGVSDAYGRWPDYTQQQFNESLPNGARQG